LGNWESLIPQHYNIKHILISEQQKVAQDFAMSDFSLILVLQNKQDKNLH